MIYLIKIALLTIVFAIPLVALLVLVERVLL
jgi:hypothetical protein